MTIPLGMAALAFGPIPPGDNPALSTGQMIVGVLQLITGGLGFIAYLITAYFVCMWMHRAYGNLLATRVQGLTYKASDPISSWFIPLANFVMPYRIMSELYRGSGFIDPSTEWKNTTTPRNIKLWWILYLLMGIVGQIAFRTPGDMAQVAQIGCDAASIAGAVLLVRIIKEINHRQCHKIPELAGSLEVNKGS
ncbi:MAG TPA: DUF4328 domain-containing protein [Candidatus Obscuribacterales bacterium]